MAACETDIEYVDGSNCKKCANSATYSDGTTANAMSMEYCKKCTAVNECTECLTGFLWTDSGNTACVVNCKGLGYESISTPKKCVTDCDADTSGSFKLAMGDETIGDIHLKCVMNCWTAEN